MTIFPRLMNHIHKYHRQLQAHSIRLLTFLPLHNSLIPPKLSRPPIQLLQGQKHRRLCALIRRLGAITLGHIRIDIPRTARINQSLPTVILLLSRQRLRPRNTARLTDRVRGARESRVLLAALVHGGREVAHDGCDVVFCFGFKEAGADGGRVLRESAGGGGDVYDAASGFEEGEEGARGEKSVVVIRVKGFFNDI